MERWLAIASLGAVLLSTPLWGQRGGRGATSMGGAGRGGFVAHSGGGFSQGAFHGGAPAGWGWRRPPFGRPIRHPFSPWRFSWGWGSPWSFGSGWWWFPGWGSSVGFGDGSSDPPPMYPASAFASPNDARAYAQNSQIQQDEIDRLSQEVDRLRERESREAERAPSQTQPIAQIHPETVLVFRDKHTQEIQNYAIVGNTLWVFTEQRAWKIPIANLDVPATTRANEDRGADFQLPKER